MEEQLETFSVRVRDAAVSLAEKGLRRGPLFLAIRHGQLFFEVQMGQ
jgi:hypothetical protein